MPGGVRDTPLPHVWLSPMVPHSCTLVWGSWGPCACIGKQQAQSCLCVLVSGCCSGPSIGQLGAGEPNSTASCQVSSHCLLQGLGREAGLLVGGLRGVRSITPSTIALLGDVHARRGVGGGPVVERGWGGGPPMVGDLGSHWWLPVSAGATGWIWPRRVGPSLARCGRDSVGLAVRLAGV